MRGNLERGRFRRIETYRRRAFGGKERGVVVKVYAFVFKRLRYNKNVPFGAGYNQFAGGIV